MITACRKMPDRNAFHQMMKDRQIVRKVVDAIGDDRNRAGLWCSMYDAIFLMDADDRFMAVEELINEAIAWRDELEAEEKDRRLFA